MAGALASWYRVWMGWYLAAGGQPEDLFFAQCGMSIEAINRHLEARGRSLKASGASNQQTIVGATSTGTHGAAYKVGAVHDSIVGLHLVCGPNRHYWLEPASRPVVSAAFVSRLGTTLLQDDDLFYAALVCFGSFGFIHGVLLETEPKFLLEKRTAANMPYNNALRLAINQWDFEGIEPSLPRSIEGPGHSLYHFEMVVNPFAFEENDASKGAYMKVMYKKPWTDSHVPPVAASPKFQYGDELLGVIQTVLDHIGDDLRQMVVKPMVTQLFPLAFNSNEEVTGTVGEIFNNPKFRCKALSAALGIPTQYSSQALDAFIALTRQDAFAGGVALRFVKGTKALLGFTQYPQTCVLEMDGVDSATNRAFCQKMWDTLELLGIPYTLHWGKINFNLTPARVHAMYGPKVQRWLQARHQLLEAPTRQVFNSPFLAQCGLDA